MGKGLLQVACSCAAAVLALGAFNAAPVAAAAAPAHVIAISTGFEHSLALLDNHTVESWGANQFSQLGNGTTTTANVPVTVCAPTVTSCPPGSPPSSYLQGVTAIAAGAFFSLVLIDGNVWAWGRAGDGSQGSLGIGSTRGSTCNGECQPVPVEVCAVGVSRCPAGSPPSSYLQGVTAIGAGTFFGLAVLGTGVVVSWGSNTSGQLGNAGIQTRSVQPVAVCAVGVQRCPPGSKASAFLSGVTSVAGGDSFSMALQGHTVLTWGQNRYGQLGNGSISGPDRCSHFACSLAPIAVKLKMPASAISAANYHSLAIVDDANGNPVGVESWGSNTEGQVGLKSDRGNVCKGDCQSIPVAVRGNWTGLTAISGGRSFSLALVGGRVVAWGSNHHPGRLGNGNVKAQNAPTLVCALLVKSCPAGSPASKYLHGVTAISGGGTVSLALLPGAVAVWGSNYRGALGNGSDAAGGTSSPIQVTGLNGAKASASTAAGSQPAALTAEVR